MADSLLDFYEKFRTQSVYLKEDLRGCYVRSEPGRGWFCKYPGKKEFSIAENTKTVCDALGEKIEISKEEYDKAEFTPTPPRIS